jgi:hypothetical protein
MTRQSSARLLFSFELVNFSAVAFRGSALGRWTETQSRPAFLSDLEPQFTARFTFAVQRLSYRRRATYVAEKEHFHFEITTLGRDLQEVANVDLACRLGRLLAAVNPSEFTGSRSQAASFKKSGGPQPLVHPNTGHDLS